MLSRAIQKRKTIRNINWRQRIGDPPALYEEKDLRFFIINKCGINK